MLMVQNRMVSAISVSVRSWNLRPRYSSSCRSRGRSEAGSGGVRSSSGRMKRHCRMTSAE